MGVLSIKLQESGIESTAVSYTRAFHKSPYSLGTALLNTSKRQHGRILDLTCYFGVSNCSSFPCKDDGPTAKKPPHDRQ
jgi:hypothetical protein